MMEIEAKILHIDPDVVIKKILALGGRLVYDGWVESTFYDDPAHSLRRVGWLLRVRERKRGGELTLKKKRQPSSVKKREELQVSLDSPREMKTILQSLGYLSQFRERKYRRSFILGAVHFEVDVIDGGDPFLEIEAPTEDAVRSSARQLGFKESDLVTYSSRDLKSTSKA